MEKIWFIVTIFGKVMVSEGPLPYDMAECQARLTEKAGMLDKQFAAENLADDAKMRIDGRQVSRADVILSCLRAAEKPKLGYTTR